MWEEQSSCKAKTLNHNHAIRSTLRQKFFYVAYCVESRVHTSDQEICSGFVRNLRLSAESWESGNLTVMPGARPAPHGHRGDPFKARIGTRVLRRHGSAFKPKGVVFDPFTNQTEGVNAPPYTPYEIIKMVIMTPVAIFRILAFTSELLIPSWTSNIAQRGRWGRLTVYLFHFPVNHRSPDNRNCGISVLYQLRAKQQAWRSMGGSRRVHTISAVWRGHPVPAVAAGSRILVDRRAISCR